ncbi:hypothetical protein [Scytonema millei]|uniref:Uncharacterized protein n=1 Tax=Scytonema millei VB511283 TaxID=1245923 RepID=A0A9X5E3I4_9CYAN|nr:hypothetical protein [Scytonema millei]NHC34432.1 hypothetical protein [Scytonema millei VB511283]
MGRKKLNRSVVNVRTAPDTANKLKTIAADLGYIYDGEGATGQLLDAIADGLIQLVPQGIEGHE